LAIAAQEELRGVVPDEIVDAAVVALRRQLAEPAEQRRRQVTVLFADVSDFTALSETLDPELLVELMNRIWERLDQVITDLGGRVDKHIGDAVMGVWGTDTTREDDPERAVRAALAIQQALGGIREETGHQVPMRVGVNTGMALLGAVGTTAELTAMGDTVNVASRLEHAAPLGGVLVSHDTYRHVRGVFDVVALEPMKMRGKAGGVRAYVVLRAKPRTFRIPSRGVEGVETRTIGRDAELARLRAEFGAVAEGAGARRVMVVGDAGVGKSRLLYELESWLELRPEQVWLLKGRALPGRQGVAHGLIREVLAERFGVLDSDQVGEVAAKLRHGFSTALSADEAETVGHWLGFDLEDGRAEQRLLAMRDLGAVARAHLGRWLGSLVADEPAALLLEDLHWADAESLELVDELVGRLRHSHLLVVGLTRPELAERRPDWFDASLPSVQIDLRPLSTDTTAELVREVFQRVDGVPDGLVDLIVERSDGNPFFVEELIKMLTDEGVVRTDAPDGRWTIDADRLDRSRVPATITGVLQARLDNLSPAERLAMQCAAVVGRVFWDDAIRALNQESTPERALVALEAARARELVFRRDNSSFDGCEEFIFKHAVLRDVTYETVLLRDRQRLHGRVAAWLTARAGERLTEYLDTIAEHHRLAAEPTAAASCLHWAARAELDRGLAASARRSVAQAVELWEQAGIAVPVGALVLLGQACRRLGDLDAAETALSAAKARATDSGGRAAALYEASRVAVERSQPARVRSLLEEAHRLADGGAPTTLIRVVRGLAWWELGHGDLDAAQHHAERALSLAEQSGDSAEVIEARDVLEAVATVRGDFDTAEQHTLVTLEMAQRIGDPSLEATAHARLGVALHLRADRCGSLDDYRAAARHYERELELERTLDSRLGGLRAVLNLAQVRLRLGDRAGTQAAVREGLAEAVAIGAQRYVTFAMLVEADRRATDGDTAGALALLGLVHANPTLERLVQQEIERILSRVALDPSALDAGLTTGATLDLDQVIAELLTEGTSPP
jgi:class 3 adenylate cyclase/tetratricopeptide (TPR) repeat protein